MKLLNKIEGLVFEKTAAKNNLSDNPATYPSELLALLYKQHPFLGKYQVNLDIKGQDDSLGYMYGVFMVSQVNEVPPDANPVGAGEMQVQPQAPEEGAMLRIPVIVAEKKAYSYDVFIDAAGKFYPLSENRVASTLFNASPYVTAPTSAAMGTSTDVGSGNINPSAPGAANSGRNGYGGGGATNKTASVLTHLNIDTDTAHAFIQSVSDSQSLAGAAKANPAFMQSLTKLASAVSKPLTKEASNRTDLYARLAHDLSNSDVTSVMKTSTGYSIRSFNRDGPADQVSISFLKYAEAQALPVEVRQTAINDGFAILSREKQAGLPAINLPDQITEATESGIYAVQTTAGDSQRAVVIKNPIRIVDGKPSDTSIVVAKSGNAVQEKVAGIRCGDLDLSSLQGSAPKGSGVFVFGDTVTEVIKVASVVTSANSPTVYLVDDPIYGRIKIASGNTNRLVRYGESGFIIPSDHIFLPVSVSSVKYGSDPSRMVKLSSANSMLDEVELRENQGHFNFSRGDTDLETYGEIRELGAAQVLVLMGDTDAGAKEKIAAAKAGAPVKFVPVHTAIFTNKTKTAGVDAITALIVEDIKIDLIKEAASLNNSDTVDSVLSLNFVTPENVQNYVDSVPQLEESVGKLAELLIGVRLGVTDIPEAAVSSALNGIERALNGLKKLQLRAGAETT
jgi:hypothetical protein